MTIKHELDLEDLEDIDSPPYWDKSMFLAYVLWFFFGWAGAHNFYTERYGIAVGQLFITSTFILSVVITALWFFTGAVLLMFTTIFMLVNGVWLIVDIFLIPGRVWFPPYDRRSRPVQNLHITIQNSGDSDK